MTRPRLICVAGAESTGKSWLTQRLADRFGCPAVPEYGRDYCLQHGNDISMEELVHIGATQQAMIAEALADAAGLGASCVLTDTDAVVTAIWADMMHSSRDPWFSGDLIVADLYLVTDNDIAWERDAIRIYGRLEQRDAFRALLVREIVRRGASWRPVGGDGPARFASAIAGIVATFPDAPDTANGAG